jgi:hypothetical protein
MELEHTVDHSVTKVTSDKKRLSVISKAHVETKTKKMAIISSYFSGESYGLLGPQMAATIIQENTPYRCIVIAVGREDDKDILQNALKDYFGSQRPLIGFSTLSGREDLFDLAGLLKKEGAVTLLAGPQSASDFIGEVDWKDHPHRFRGVSSHFTFALHGPGEQAIGLLQKIDTDEWQKTPGLLYLGQDGKVIQNAQKDWDESFLCKVHWDNLYRLGKEGLVPLKVTLGQVLQQIGCPHAGQEKEVEIDYPADLGDPAGRKIKISTKGCSFCDVASDKGFCGNLSMSAVIEQVIGLPETRDGAKIPFELINENPLPKLPELLKEVEGRGLRLTQIHLILRADWFMRGEAKLREALEEAKKTRIRLLLSSIGFESFSDRILANLHKGLTVETNLAAVRLMRQLKDEFPRQWGYSRSEGAIHGFIHPTPWDTEEIGTQTRNIINARALPNDILPDHSIPLIIHHASALGEWIREIEVSEGIRYKRLGSIIGWWEKEDEGFL